MTVLLLSWLTDNKREREAERGNSLFPQPVSVRLCLPKRAPLPKRDGAQRETAPAGRQAAELRRVEKSKINLAGDDFWGILGYIQPVVLEKLY